MSEQNTKLYTTGEIAKLCGVSVRTVQYYDTRNILIPSTLSEGGRRLYSEDALKQLKIICFLRELGLPLDSIGKLMQEENSLEVISLILEEQEKLLSKELAEKQDQLNKLTELRQSLKKAENFSVETIGDVAHMMKNKTSLKKIRWTMLLTAIPVGILQWASIILWIMTGKWWLFAVYVAVAVVYGIWVSKFYFKRVSYICPECHVIFKPGMKTAFWANHTPTTRKLTCPKCGYKGFCVETISEEETI